MMFCGESEVGLGVSAMIRSRKERCQAVIDAGGLFTKY